MALAVLVTSQKSVGLSTQEIKLTDTTLSTEVKYSKEGKIGLKSNNSISIQEKLCLNLNNDKYLKIIKIIFQYYMKNKLMISMTVGEPEKKFSINSIKSDT